MNGHDFEPIIYYQITTILLLYWYIFIYINTKNFVARTFIIVIYKKYEFNNHSYNHEK